MFHTPSATSRGWYAGTQSDVVGVRDKSLATNMRSNLNERIHSLRDFIKRFHYFGNFPLSNIPIADSNLGGAFGYMDLGELISAGAFSVFNAAYRAVSGDLRVKIIGDFTSADTQHTMHVFYIPPYVSVSRFPANQTIGSAAYVASVVASYLVAGNLVNSTPLKPKFEFAKPTVQAQVGGIAAAYWGYPNSTPKVDMPSLIQNTLTAEVITITAPSVELEIPFYSPSRYVVTPSYNSASEEYAYCENPYGYLAFWAPPVALAVGGSLPTTPVNPTVSVYAAGGDTMRYAQYSVPVDRGRTLAARNGQTQFNFYPGTNSSSTAATLATDSLWDPIDSSEISDESTTQ